jgi:thiol-disulfide isomerase/thioredoxin
MARRLLPSLILLGLLAPVLLHHLLNQQRPGGAEEQSFTVAGQEAVEADVAHRVVVVEGRLLADGAPWSSTSARGSVLVVNSWASWCGPCRAEQPSLTAVARAYRTKGVQVIGVNIRDNKGRGQSLRRRVPGALPVVVRPRLHHRVEAGSVRAADHVHPRP